MNSEDRVIELLKKQSNGVKLKAEFDSDGYMTIGISKPILLLSNRLKTPNFVHDPRDVSKIGRKMDRSHKILLCDLFYW